MELPRIAIIGGGPAGLTFARLLQTEKIPCTLFELDASRSARNPSYQGTLDLHTATGQAALKQAGLLPKFQELSRLEGEEFKMVDSKTLHPYLTKDPPPPGEPNKPEIMRTDLREMLLDSLQPDSVKWGKKLIEVKPASGSYDLYFQDGSVEKGFDLVVGADGTWSRVRPLLSSEVPHYAGVSWVAFETPEKDIRQDLNDLIGQGAVLSAKDKKMMWGQRLTGGNILCVFCIEIPQTWVDEVGIHHSDGEKARKTIAEKYLEPENWSETWREIVLGSKSVTTAKPFWQLPIGFKWENRPGITLIGDSAHVMTPFAGVGANVGLEDALELAREIIKRKDGGKRAIVEDAVKAYEQSMFPRAEENATLTEENKQRVFGDSVELEGFQI